MTVQYRASFVLFLLFAFLAPSMSSGQEEIKEGETKMGKTKLWCFYTTFREPKSETIEIIEKDLATANLKRTSRKKGFFIYKGVQWPAMSNNRGDYYYKVHGKKNKTTVYLCASKGYDNYVTTASDSMAASKVKTYLADLPARVEQLISIHKKEAELKQTEQKTQKLEKQLQETKKEEAKQSGELNNMKIQKSADPVK
jgi:hypothetical protein